MIGNIFYQMHLQAQILPCSGTSDIYTCEEHTAVKVSSVKYRRGKDKISAHAQGKKISSEWPLLLHRAKARLEAYGPPCKSRHGASPLPTTPSTVRQNTPIALQDTPSG